MRELVPSASGASEKQTRHTRAKPASTDCIFHTDTGYSMRRPGSFFVFAGFAAGTIVAAWFGSRYSPAKGESKLWYRGLRKPLYNPPKLVFPIVWPVLYALIAWSGYRVWRRESSPERSRALALWAAQL